MATTTLPNTLVGHFEQYVDHDFYRVELVAGQRYFFQIERLVSGSRPVYTSAALRLTDAAGQLQQTTQRFGTERDPIGFAFTASVSGTYYLDASNLASANGTVYAGGDYRISAYTLPPDSHPASSRDQAIPLSLTAAVGIDLDLPGDQDWLRIDLLAGHHYRFELQGLDPADQTKTMLGFYSADGTLVQAPVPLFKSGTSQLSPNMSGTYYVLLERDASEGASQGAAHFTFRAWEYGSAMVAAAAEPHVQLPIDTTVVSSLEVQPEEDVYDVTLVAGHRYLFELQPAGSSPVGRTSLWVEALDQSQAAINVSAADGMSLAVLQAAPGVSAWTVKVTNDRIIGINGQTVTGSYSVRYTEVPLDDHSDLLGTASTPMALGQTLAGNFDYRVDVDTFQVQLVEGKTYSYVMKGVGTNRASHFYIEVTNAEHERVSFGHTLSGNAGDAGSFVAPTSGLYYLRAGFTGDFTAKITGGDYSVQILEAGADDHGDALASATPLSLGTSVNGRFDYTKDLDVFRFDTVAGQRYAIEIGKGNLRDSLQVSLKDAKGVDLTLDAILGEAAGNPAGTLYCSTPMATTLYLALEQSSINVGATYTVRLATAPNDDVGDAPGQARLLGTAPTGQPAAGTDGADTMGGSRFDDRFQESRGNDTITGGGGIDTVQYAGSRSSYTLKRAANGWQVTGPGTGTDTLSGIERLAFDGPDLALDIGGHAGTVAKILGALFGTAALRNSTYVGIGLDLLDDGMSYQDLVALAVAAPVFTQAAGGTSNSAFVRFVFQNVFGRLPTAAEQQPIVKLLDDGSYTKADLAYVACEHAANAAHVDLTGLAETGLAFTPVG